MKTTKAKIDDLKPYGKNNKKHSDIQVQEIRKSIVDYGYIQPIVIDKNNEIIIGHGRLEAIKQLRDMGSWNNEVDVVRLEDLTEKQVRKLRLLDNKLSDMAERDMENIEFELEELQDEGLNKMFEMDILTDEQEEQQNMEDIIDDDINIIKTDIKQGDYFEIGTHRLLCGDSTNPIDIEKLIKDKSEEKTHCISDPPYGIKYNNKKKHQGMIKNDDKILDYCNLAKKYTDGFFAMWTGYQVVDKRKQLIEKHFGKLNNMIVRHKGGGGMGDCEKTLAQDFEILLVVNRGNKIQGYRGGSTRYWNIEQKKKFILNSKKEKLKEVLENLIQGESIRKVKKDNTCEYLHPTQKPVEINCRVLENFTAINENVLDLFGGSGSNMIACNKMMRRCFMMEIDPKYCQVIVNRMKKNFPNLTIKKNGNII